MTLPKKKILNTYSPGWRHVFPAKEHSNIGCRLGENAFPFQWIPMQLVELTNLCPDELGSLMKFKNDV